MSVAVTRHSKGGKHVGFKKMIGGRLFHLVTGTSAAHEAQAKAVATALMSEWERLKAAGHAWTADGVAAAYRAAGAVPQGEPRPRWVSLLRVSTPNDQGSLPTAMQFHPAHVDNGPLLHDCVNRFKERETRRFNGGEIDDDTLFQTLQLAEKAKEGMPNKPINLLTIPELDQMRLHWTGRPTQKATGNPIALPTVGHLIRITKTILYYCKRYEG